LEVKDFVQVHVVSFEYFF
jgi:hypothetical protein